MRHTVCMSCSAASRHLLTVPGSKNGIACWEPAAVPHIATAAAAAWAAAGLLGGKKGKF